jgi:hypothetical protein
MLCRLYFNLLWSLSRHLNMSRNASIKLWLVCDKLLWGTLKIQIYVTDLTQYEYVF